MDKIIRPKGYVELYKDGVKIKEFSNLVVDTGIYFLLDRLISSGDLIGYWNIGDGLTPASSSDTELINPSLEGRSAILTATRTNNVITITGQAGGSNYNQVWGEMGLFFHVSNSNSLFSRTVFEPYTKISGEVIDFIWKISI